MTPRIAAGAIAAIAALGIVVACLPGTQRPAQAQATESAGDFSAGTGAGNVVVTGYQDNVTGCRFLVFTSPRGVAVIQRPIGAGMNREPLYACERYTPPRAS